MNVDTDLTEVALDAFPGAARGDGHFLMVITRRAAGGECVAEPESVVEGNGVGCVRERRGALVGGNHEIGVIAVAPDDSLRRCHTAGDNVVCQVEQPADEGLVAGDDLGLYLFPCAGRWQALRDEAAFGAHRHDECVFDILGLHETQDLGAEILAPVGPADAAARHVAHAQMHAFDPWTVDEDLEFRARQRQIRDLAGIELEGDVALGLARGVRLIEVGSQSGLHEIHIRAQNAVFIEARDFVEIGADLRDQLVGVALAAFGDGFVGGAGRLGAVAGGLAGGRRVEMGFEEANEVASDGGVGPQRALHVRLAERHAGLQKVAAIGPQYRDLAGVEAGAEQEAIETVVLDFTAPGGGESVLEVCFQARVIDVETLAVLELEILDPRGAAFRPHEFVGALGDDPEAEVLQHGQQVRDRHRIVKLHNLQMHTFGFRVRRTMQLEAHGLRLFAQSLQVREVLESVGRHHIFLVGHRKGAPITGR